MPSKKAPPQNPIPIQSMMIQSMIEHLPKSRLTGKPVLHFVHANGFVGECYQALFEIWTQYFTVVAIMRFGNNPNYPIDDNWQGLTDEVADSIAKTCQQHGIATLVAVGHSVGAMTSLQAVYRGNANISQLVALDPPLLMGRTAMAWHLAKWLDQKRGNHAMMDKLSPSGKSKFRRDVFACRNQAYQALRDKGLFADFDERAFLAYIHHGMTDLPNGQVGLSIAKKHEVAIFRTIPTWTWYKKPSTTTPITLIVGKNSHFTQMGSYQKACDVFGLPLVYHQGSHMFALEYPISVAQMVLDTIANTINQNH